MFGRGCRLPVAAWVRAHGQKFHQSRPPTFGTTSRSNITTELARLTAAGMLVRDDVGDGKVWYDPTDSPLWEIVDVAARVTGLRWDGDRLDAG